MVDTEALSVGAMAAGSIAAVLERTVRSSKRASRVQHAALFATAAGTSGFLQVLDQSLKVQMSSPQIEGLLMVADFARGFAITETLLSGLDWTDLTIKSFARNKLLPVQNGYDPGDDRTHFTLNQGGVAFDWQIDGNSQVGLSSI